MADTNDQLDAYVSERRDLIALARSIVGNTDVAEDLVQDSWLRWSTREYALDHARPILMRIVKNLAFDWHRRRRVEFEVLEAQHIFHDTPPDTERIVIARQRLDKVTRALQTLPPRTLLAFRYCRVDSMTLKETGKKLGVSESRACQLVSNAIIHIIAELDEE